MNFETNTDSKRKLASIQVVSDVTSHPNADRLNISTILGWKVITTKEEAKVGDKIIYVEIDGMLPNSMNGMPPAVKTRLDKQKDDSFYHVKTIKIRGYISQGLIVPIVGELKHMQGYPIGTNVTGELGIFKYEAPSFDTDLEPSHKKFPSHLVPKTDETRIQSVPELLSMISNQPYYITVKCDGTSGTFLIDPINQELTCCSRNLIRTKPSIPNRSHPYWYVANKLGLEDKLRSKPYLAIQGEVCGPSVQKNKLNLKDLELLVFNIVDMRDRRSLTFLELVETCKELKLTMVPIVESGDSYKIGSIDDLLKLSEGKYAGSKQQREGIVIRLQDQSVSFKVINNKYLLKHGQ